MSTTSNTGLPIQVGKDGKLIWLTFRGVCNARRLQDIEDPQVGDAWIYLDDLYYFNENHEWVEPEPVARGQLAQATGLCLTEAQYHDVAQAIPFDPHHHAEVANLGTELYTGVDTPTYAASQIQWLGEDKPVGEPSLLDHMRPISEIVPKEQQSIMARVREREGVNAVTPFSEIGKCHCSSEWSKIHEALQQLPSAGAYELVTRIAKWELSEQPIREEYRLVNLKDLWYEFRLRTIRLNHPNLAGEIDVAYDEAGKELPVDPYALHVKAYQHLVSKPVTNFVWRTVDGVDYIQDISHHNFHVLANYSWHAAMTQAELDKFGMTIRISPV